MPGGVSQAGGASHGSNLLQAGGDVTVVGDVIAVAGAPVVPVMESVPAVSWVGRVPVVPGSFVGRGAELARLDAVVAGSSGGRAVVVAVHGLGGVGKSTLAARFAEVQGARFSLVWWITADSPAALEVGVADLATALAPQSAVLPVEQRVELGVRWLAAHEDWLLVLDNVTAPGEVAGLLERVRTGTVVITSRRGSGWRGVQTVRLDVLPADEAVDLLARIVRSEWPGADLAGGDRLCAELGWLPLAVEQAGAYLAQNRITPTTYLDLLARSRCGCSPRRRRAVTRSARWRGSGTSPSTGWPTPRWRGGCCGSWRGTPPTASLAPCRQGWSGNRICPRRWAGWPPTT
ncbi:hypothetical protein FHS29_003892 [Saccharothrix tamanrassetensis]|uniref:Orc1-like AAA ATPase domain-containing protein n=1 Tax=Saccharothrix tamanrassetensis TaxID=1051531 RepID=A0A841CJ19_9PSEU|nr:AAA family ATPase [Saccharothrix tamanrassetensis]MBB5957299.1 hypothetical protein [Saccharothrix tamanrassetensis]